ncbi:MAG TPA: chromosomal replication initiator DnaA [Acetobacteraceae bacterium]|nr:chromosomal replication initiator DnaA [Acetobacteraceae bacterium]
MPDTRQLPLPFIHRPEFAGDFLEAASNAAALTWLARAGDWPGGRLAIWGDAGCGKTHLLHHWVGRVGGRYLCGPVLRQDPPTTALAIDDADAVPEPTVLLHILNAAAEAGLPVLLAARQAPARWRACLPDLASRLRAVTAVEIGPAEDSLLKALFARLLADRVQVPACLQDWIRLRLPRTPGALREAAARLDRASLAAGGAVTRSLAASLLEGLRQGEG